ncbi:hypothetical protein HMPREF9123_1878 [Neisseria bacilliformis ATCC BAA-1200]|uniref:Uncharacterized protein n=1 Tax=Neisseria bacilliformis ATCC BAA-1200 TaxID=888742 RepID=F2BDS2_9NEIS|nr:hypothetical protein HMPREF9123_1878 [Neisseria bacilliformis ATCC BAA-1200]
MCLRHTPYSGQRLSENCVNGLFRRPFPFSDSLTAVRPGF